MKWNFLSLLSYFLFLYCKYNISHLLTCLRKRISKQSCAVVKLNTRVALKLQNTQAKITQKLGGKKGTGKKNRREESVRKDPTKISTHVLSAVCIPILSIVLSQPREVAPFYYTSYGLVCFYFILHSRPCDSLTLELKAEIARFARDPCLLKVAKRRILTRQRPIQYSSRQHT